MSKKNMMEILIGILAIVSIVLLVIESLFSVSMGLMSVIYIVDLIICCVFLLDFVYRLSLSENRLKFSMTNGYEILAMIPAIALHALEVIPTIAIALRLIRLVRVIRIVIVFARMRRVLLKWSNFIQHSNLLMLFGITLIIILAGAYAVLMLDYDVAGAQITNFSDAVWWSISTVTTVGYGDIVPHSISGRVLGMVLMVIGIGVMAAFISQVSATLVESRLQHEVKGADLKIAIISELKNKLDNIDTMSESDFHLFIQTIQTLRVGDVVEER